MKKYVGLGMSLLAVAIFSGAAPSQTEKAPERVLKVKVSYTGAGSVDEKHQIFVALWDSPDFMTGVGGIPIATAATSAKDGTVTFDRVTKSPVYASTAYDPKGSWDGQSGPPPSGSSLGVYSKTPGKPEPIDVPTGKTIQVEISFDDSYKMP
jgi:hypothetical protein